MTDKDRPRLYVTAGVFIVFGWILYWNVENEMLIGAVIGAFGTTIAFWLGSSKGSSDKSSQLEEITRPSAEQVNVTADQVNVEERP